MKITLNRQYHIGSGFGLGRIIDSLLKVDADGIPVLPGSTVIGLCAQGLFDLLRFDYFSAERMKICDFHYVKKGEDEKNKKKLRLPCAIRKRNPEETCFLCYFFGSTAQEGIITCKDFTCHEKDTIMVHLLKSNDYTPDEKRQYIKEAASHKQNMRTRTVKKKHLFVKEEGAGDLVFHGVLEFRENVEESKAIILAAAIKNIKAIGQRKSRGKGACKIKADFNGVEINRLIEEIGSQEDLMEE